MSQLEVVKNQLYSQSYTLVVGVGAVVNPTNYNATSRLLSIVRTAVGGTVGTPACRVVVPSLAGANSVWGLGLFSTNALDTSTYTVYWFNQYDSSPSYVQGGATVNAQFAP
jgi:hypothetical protein